MKTIKNTSLQKKCKQQDNLINNTCLKNIKYIKYDNIKMKKEE